MNLEENEYKDNFTKEGDKTNLNINKLEVDCITSNQNNFSLDEEGNLKVNSISLNNTNTDIDLIYPIGSIYMNVSNVNPNTLFGGTWEEIKDRFLLASGENYQNGTTGGEKEHTLTVSEMPSHGHSWTGVNDGTIVENIMGSYPLRIYQDKKINWNGTSSSIASSGGSQPHNNMPPYLAVNIWKRIA